jgi:hypothetical protein
MTKFKRYWIVFLLAFLTLSAIAIIRFGPHILWRISQPWNLADGVQAVPVSPLVDAPVSEEMVRIHFGSVSVKVPAAMAVNPKFKTSSLHFCSLCDGTREMTIILPINDRAVQQAYRDQLAHCGAMTSTTRAKEEAYRSAATDFRWTMSREELACHRWRIGEAWSIRMTGPRAIETRYAEDIEGLLILTERFMNSFEWVSTDGAAASSILFDQRPGPLDLKWVRAVCASFRFSGGTFDQPMTVEEVARLFRVE